MHRTAIGQDTPIWLQYAQLLVVPCVLFISTLPNQFMISNQVSAAARQRRALITSYYDSGVPEKLK